MQLTRERISSLSLMALSCLMQGFIWMPWPSPLIFWMLLNHSTWRTLTPLGSRPLPALSLSLSYFSLVGSTPLHHVLKPLLPGLKVLCQLWVGTPGGPGTSVAAVFPDVLQHLFTSPGRRQPISSCLHLHG